MKKVICLVAVMLLAASSVSFADEYVSGYTRSNGTYVQGYYRSSPDSTINNNYSTQGNINPYTGEEGTVPRDNYNNSNPIRSRNRGSDDDLF